MDDLLIKEEVYLEMVSDIELEADQVDMTVVDGHVVLVGVVGSRVKAEKIFAIARGTRGVKAVKSFLQVAR